MVGSVLGMSSPTDVDGGEDGEDVGLKERKEYFECRQEDQHEQRQYPERDQCRVAFGLEERFGEKSERHEQNVARKHVGEQSHRQRERTHEEGRDELDRGHEEVQGLRYARREQRILQVAQSLMLEAGADEDDPDEERQEHRQSHAGRRWHLQERDDSRDVAEIDEREKAEEEWSPSEPVTTHCLHDDAVFDELDDRFGEVTNAFGGRLRIFAAGEQEHDRSDERCRDSDDRDLVERRKEILPTEDLVDRRELEGDHRLWFLCPGTGTQANWRMGLSVSISEFPGFETGVCKRSGNEAHLPHEKS